VAFLEPVTTERSLQGRWDGSAMPIVRVFPHIMQQATCQFARLFKPALASILHSNMGKGGRE
jgi:hypothetical protein